MKINRTPVLIILGGNLSVKLKPYFNRKKVD
jgi:hypothetical protein